jgi:hypothetical protein
MLTHQKKFNGLITMLLMKIKRFFLLDNGTVHKFKALQD